MAISTNGTIITRLAGALYGEYLSNASYTEVKETAAATVAADMIKNDFAGKTDAQLATAILTNLGLTSVTGLDNWVAAQLTAAGSSASAKGAKLVEMLNGYANMTADATYGASATSFNAKVEASLVLSQTAGTKAGAFGTANADKNQTITLTADLETVEGGAANDRFIASYGSTLDSGDSIVGGDGTDTLSISVTGSDVTAETVTILANGIEKITVANTETDTAADITFDLASAGSSVAAVGTYASTAAGDTSFTNVGSIVAIEAAGKGDVSVSYTTGVTSGAADVQSIALNGAGTSSSSRATITSAGIETINLSSNGSSNFVTITDTALKTLNVTGSKALTVSNTSAYLTTVDASAFTGALTVLEPASTDITITGGTANDKLRIDGSTINALDNINVGDGVDTLELTAASNVGSAASGAALKGFEQVYGYRSYSDAGAGAGEADDLTISQVISYVSGVTTVGVTSWSVTDTAGDDEDGVATNDGVSFTGLSAEVSTLNLSGISFTSTDHDGEDAGGIAFTATATMGIDTQADSINVVLGTTSARAQSQSGGDAESSSLTVTLVDYENITLTSQGDTNTITALNVSDLQKLTISASKALTITDISGEGALFKTIDASASSANVNLSGNALGGAGTVLGGAGNDTLDGSALSDSIGGGSGNDSLTGGTGNDSVYGNAGNDVIDGGTGNDKLYGEDGNDTLVAGSGYDVIEGGSGNDSVSLAITNTSGTLTFADLASTDAINGGDGNDYLYLSGASEEGTDTLSLSSSSITTFAGVTNVEGITVGLSGSEAADTVSIGLGDIVLGAFSNNLTVNWAATSSSGYDAQTRAYAVAVDASSVLNSSSTVTTAAPSGRALTYTLGNNIDKATGSTAADTFIVTNPIFFSASDVLKGGSNSDTLSSTQATASPIDMTITAATLAAALSSVETISIDTATDEGESSEGDGGGNYFITLDDAAVANNYDNSNVRFSVTRAADDIGNLKVDGTLVTSAYSLYITGGAGNSTLEGASTATGDTLIGGAGNDVLNGGKGTKTDTITLTAGGTDTIKYSSDGTNNITGFTTYTNGVSSSAQSGYDKIGFVVVDDTSSESEIFSTSGNLVFATEFADATAAGFTITAAEYNEFAGNSTAAGTGLAANKVNIITGRGYDLIETALDYNGVTDDASTDANDTLLAAAMIVGFYNTSAQRVEMYYVAATDADDNAGGISSTSTLIGYYTDITLTGIAGFAKENFVLMNG
jgi:hypothetical protein